MTKREIKIIQSKKKPCDSIPVIDIFDTFYKLYHDHGLTSTAVKFMEELNIADEWRFYIKDKE